MNSFVKIAEHLVAELNKNEVKSYIWHVVSGDTGSVYIRFEDPNIGSIRIANHAGREKLKYKYNLRTDLHLSKGKWVKEENVWSYFGPVEQWKDLIPLLINRKAHVCNWKKRYYFIPKHKRNEHS